MFFRVFVQHVMRKRLPVEGFSYLASWLKHLELETTYKQWCVSFHWWWSHYKSSLIHVIHEPSLRLHRDNTSHCIHDDGGSWRPPLDIVCGSFNRLLISMTVPAGHSVSQSRCLNIIWGSSVSLHTRHIMHVQAHGYLHAVTQVHWVSGSPEHKGSCVQRSIQIVPFSETVQSWACQWRVMVLIKSFCSLRNASKRRFMFFPWMIFLDEGMCLIISFNIFAKLNSVPRVTVTASEHHVRVKNKKNE